MDNNLVKIKVKERLNKLSSEDYDNLECWQIQEAFNKAQIQWCRKQIHGNNLKQEGDESSKMLIDDMQVILLEAPIGITPSDKYYLTDAIPEDYLYFKKIKASSKSECCKDSEMRVHLSEVADVDDALADELTKPSIEWGETFCTINSNRIRIYTNGEFSLSKAKLFYYRLPRNLEFLNCVNPSNDEVYTADVECEFKNDIVDLLIDETVVVLAGDLELFNNYQRTKTNATEAN